MSKSIPLLNTPRRQAGMTAYALLLVLLVGGFFALCTVKIAPHYVDFMQLKKAMAALSSEPNAKDMTVREVNKSLQTKLTMNRMQHVGMDSFTVQETDDGLVVNLAYEIQEHLFANIDVLLTFEEQVEVF
jgi:hypothetical protein